MKIEFLGTGGAVTIPRPFCHCRICIEAREKGIPYARSGPATFVHGPDILIDTPEEIADQLARSQVERIAAGFYSHWHPDHVMGRRLWEFNNDWRHWPRRHVGSTPIYLPERVASDFKRYLGGWEHLHYLESQGLIEVRIIKENEPLQVGSARVTPIRLAVEFVFAFLVEQEGTHILIAPDELAGWIPPSELERLDAAVLPMGLVEVNPLTGERNFSVDHPVLQEEATFEETLEIIGRMDVKTVYLTHIEEPDQISHDELLQLQAQLNERGFPIHFPHDGLVVEV